MTVLPRTSVVSNPRKKTALSSSNFFLPTSRKKLSTSCPVESQNPNFFGRSCQFLPRSWQNSPLGKMALSLAYVPHVTLLGLIGTAVRAHGLMAVCMMQVDPKREKQLQLEWNDYAAMVRACEGEVQTLEFERDTAARNIRQLECSCTWNPCLDDYLGIACSNMCEADDHGVPTSLPLLDVAGRVKQLQSVKGQRLQSLERAPWMRGISDVARWIEENRAQFKGQVYGPLIAEITVANDLHASMLEQSVPSARINVLNKT